MLQQAQSTRVTDGNPDRFRERMQRLLDRAHSQRVSPSELELAQQVLRALCGLLPAKPAERG